MPEVEYFNNLNKTKENKKKQKSNLEHKKGNFIIKKK